MKYTINYDKIKYREEENGTYSFMNSTTGKIVFLNKVASFIYLHNEINTLEAFVDKLIERFEVPSVEKVQQDCINALYIMSALELLTIDDDNDNSVVEGCYVAGESDYKKISQFIVNSFKQKKNVLFFLGKDLNYYSHYSIRARQFNNKEYNFIYFNNRKEIIAQISLGVITNSTFTLLNAFADTNNLDKVKELINYAFLVTPKLNKICLSLNSDTPKKAFKNAEYLGFKLEAILKDEISINVDLLNYAIFRE